MRKLLFFAKPYIKYIAGASVLILISTICDLMLPTIMADVLNFGVHDQDMDYILSSCLKMLTISLIGLVAVIFGVRCSTFAVAKFCSQVRSEIFKKVNTLSFGQIGKLGTAALVTRATHDVDTVSWVVSELSGTIMTIPVLFFGGVILSFRKDVYLSLLLLAFVPVILLVVTLVGRKIVPLWEKSDEYIDRQNHLVRQRLRGIRVIRAYNAEGREHEKIADATRLMAENIIKSNVSMGVITPVATLLLNISTILVVYFGGVRLEMSNDLSGGDIFAIVQYISLISSALIMGAFSIIMFPHAKIAAKRINQILNAENMNANAGVLFRELSGRIRLDNVSFRYDTASEYAIKDISMDIQAGETVAIIGGTGAGKSTVVKLLLGFHVPTDGVLYYDEFSSNVLSPQCIRDNISCVLQAPSIYTGSVMENVSMSSSPANEDVVIEALKTAQALEFVEAYSDGLAHQLKQSGKNLSGGQKQRICIARALVKRVPIYIFDDSFSALDFITERKLRRALQDHLREKTQIIITQRVTTAMYADKIFVLDKGRLVGFGDHDSLLRQCDIYKSIYSSQTGGERD